MSPRKDRRDARRHHGAHQRARGCQAGREPVRVASLEHLRDLDLARGRGIREGGAADPREADRGAQVDVREAGEPRQQGTREVVEPCRDAELVGDRSDEDEQRNSEQRKAVDAVHDRRDRVAGREAVAVEVQHARCDHREGDRHPQQQRATSTDVEPEIHELALHLADVELVLRTVGEGS